MRKINTVSIKFRPGAYGVFRNLQNKVWYALGEYVDNAVQSYNNNIKILQKLHKNKYQFVVDITIDWEHDFIKIIDNAGGIDKKNFIRAFEPANIPLDNTGLHEFGMGMKTASIWLSDFWSVKTSALGEVEERYVEFDLKKVLKEKRELLKVTNKIVSKKEHYTEITLHTLTKNAPSSFQMSKIKSHLSSIYRNYIRSNKMTLIINGEELTYETPKILNAPYYDNLNAKPKLWKKEINVTHGKCKARGFIALLETMSNNEHNGLSLFRRGRVIEGSHDEKYRPKVLFGQVGSHRYKRLFGELEIGGFDVSFNKGSFQDQDGLLDFMEIIKGELNKRDFNLLKQADELRSYNNKRDNLKVATKIVNSLNDDKEKGSLKIKVETSIKELEESKKSEDPYTVKKIKSLGSYEDIIEIKGKPYKLKVDFINEPKVLELYSLSELEDEKFTKFILYKMNLAHPFFSRFEQFKKEKDYKPIVQIVRSLVLAEIFAPLQGTKNAGNIRINFNSFLRNI